MQAQLNSLTPLKVPRQLLARKKSKASSDQGEEEAETGSSVGNQTDKEKTILRKTASLIEVSFGVYEHPHRLFDITIYLQDLKRMCLAQVLSSTKQSPQPETEESPPKKPPAPREQLSNNVARILKMQRRTNEVSLCNQF